MMQPDCWFYYSDEGWYYAPIGRHEPHPGPFETWDECLSHWRQSTDWRRQGI